MGTLLHEERLCDLAFFHDPEKRWRLDPGQLVEDGRIGVIEEGKGNRILLLEELYVLLL